MDPLTFNLVAGFILKLYAEFRTSGDELTEDEIKARFEADYTDAMRKNAALLDETKG